MAAKKKAARRIITAQIWATEKAALMKALKAPRQIWITVHDGGNGDVEPGRAHLRKSEAAESLDGRYAWSGRVVGPYVLSERVRER